MNCPRCRDKKGKPVRVDPVSRKCPACRASVSVDHTGKPVAAGGRSAAAPKK
jgi:hypothetical protein